jgi:DnaJ-domain-containing protein 1
MGLNAKPRLRLRTSRRFIATILGVLLAATLAGDPATAGEGVRLAYRCEMANGRAQLRAGDETTYRISGRRDAKEMLLCAESGRCRSLVVHRFAFDCAGQKANWLEAMTSTTRGQPWRAQVSDGQLTLRGLVLDGGGRVRSVTLPAGFAPPPAGGLRFVPLPEAPLAGKGKPGNAQQKVAGTRAESERPTGLTDARTVAAGAAKRSSGTDGPAGMEGYGPARPTSPRPAAEVADREKPAEPSGEAVHGWTVQVSRDHGSEERGLERSAGLIWLGALLGVVLSAWAVATRHSLVLGKGPTAHATADFAKDRPSPAGSPADTIGSSGVPPIEPPSKAAPLPPTISSGAAQGAAAGASGGEPETAGVPDRRSRSQAVNSVRNGIEAMQAVVGRIVTENVPEGPLRAILLEDLQQVGRKLAEADKAEGAGARGTLEAACRQAIVDLERIRKLARIEVDRSLTPTGADDAGSPSTTEEALAFLGVNPRADPSVVKKAVDALRQNWHPDHAHDEEDRREREERIKHINAAWDLVRTSGGAAARGSASQR